MSKINFIIIKRRSDIVFFIFSIILLLGCNSGSKIFTDHLKSNKPLDHGFDIFEISVNKYNQEGRPTKYEVLSGVSVSPITAISRNPNFDRYSKFEKKVMLRCRLENDSILKLNEGKGIRFDGTGIGVDEYLRNEVMIDSLIKIRFPFESQRKLYFNKKNPNYIWSYCRSGYNTCIFDFDGGHHEIMPEKFKINQWYMIDLSNASNIKEKLFFKIHSDSSLEQYYYYNANQWG